jgi:hypothetical protein
MYRLLPDPSSSWRKNTHPMFKRMCPGHWLQNIFGQEYHLPSAKVNGFNLRGFRLWLHRWLRLTFLPRRLVLLATRQINQFE